MCWLAPYLENVKLFALFAADFSAGDRRASPAERACHLITCSLAAGELFTAGIVMSDRNWNRFSRAVQSNSTYMISSHVYMMTTLLAITHAV